MDVDENSQRCSPIWILLSSRPAFDKVFEALSPATLVHLARVCKAARGAVSDYFSRAFDINDHLARFFDDPIKFRNLQARTSTLISGSNALQFLDRTFYPESDLDLYVHPGHGPEVGHWLLDNGYVFIPNSTQNPDFDQAGWSASAIREIDQQDVVDTFHDQHYHIVDIAGVFTFMRLTEPGSSGVILEEPLKVQIIVSASTPMACILSFHSTCVMNVISYDKAISFFPHATFEERKALILTLTGKHAASALRKYALRGFAMMASIFPHDHRCFHEGKRWADDSESWVLPLDMTKIECPRPLSVSSHPLLSDPVIYNGWVIDVTPQGPVIQYKTAKPAIFRYQYLIGDDDFLRTLIPFFIEQGKVEFKKRQGEDVDQDNHSQLEYWTWWDAELPKLRKAYFDECAKKKMDTGA